MKDSEFLDRYETLKNYICSKHDEQCTFCRNYIETPWGDDHFCMLKSVQKQLKSAAKRL